MYVLVFVTVSASLENKVEHEGHQTRAVTTPAGVASLLSGSHKPKGYKPF